MPYTLAIDPALELLEVVYDGPLTLASRVAAMREGAQLLAAHGYRRVLVDLRNALPGNDADAPDAQQISRGVAQAPLVEGSRLAYLARPHQVASLRAENMAAARHAAMRHFTTRDEALRWLAASPAARHTGSLG